MSTTLAQVHIKALKIFQHTTLENEQVHYLNLGTQEKLQMVKINNKLT
jgi:hypothetical protein